MGAWTQLYRKGQTGQPGSPLAYAIVALKYELDYNGLGTGLTLDGTTFGVTMAQQVEAFQASRGLTADGVVGPSTAKRLFAKRMAALEASYGIEPGLICKAVSLESACDPGAVGVVDPADHGLVQINATAHPEVSLQQAFTPSFALAYYARTVAAVYAKTHDWDCAVAAWNVGGGGADSWCGLHKPSTGGPSWFPDLFSRATEYVALVKEQQC
jgi:Putative peptidoglycan binding domain/Transglycosylase SLT domain